MFWNRYKAFLLTFFGVMICFMAVVKPLVNPSKKLAATEQQEQEESACPEACDEEADKETSNESTEWNDEFLAPPILGFVITQDAKAPAHFLYLVHFSEYEASISLPPPEFFHSFNA